MLFIVEGAGEVEVVVDAVLTSTGVDILPFVVLGCVVSDAVVDEVVLISACVEVVLLLVVLLSAGVDVLMVAWLVAVETGEAVMLLIFNPADVASGAVIGETAGDEVVEVGVVLMVVVLLSAGVDVLLPVWLVAVVVDNVEAKVWLTFNTADVVLGDVAETADDEDVVIFASVDVTMLPVVLGVVLLFVVLGPVVTETDVVVLSSADIDVLLLIWPVAAVPGTVDANVLFTFSTADVALGDAADESVDAEVAGVGVGPALLIVVVGPPSVTTIEAVGEKERFAP